MTPIRIAHVVEAVEGGVARHLIDLITRLDPAEFTCLVYASLQRSPYWSARIMALREVGVTIREIPMAQVPNRAAVRQIAEWGRRDAIDILHLHSARAGFLGRQALAGSGCATVYTPHAFPFQRTTDWLRPFYRLQERRQAAQTTVIICVSAGERDEALAAGLPEEKLVVIPNGLDFTHWPAPTVAERTAARTTYGMSEGELIIGMMARLAPQKGADVLISAAVETLTEFPRARILLWGTGPRRESLQRTIRNLHLRRIHLMGETTDPRLAYLAMDVFCAPSRWEAGPYSVLEAMACRLPVVASDVPGNANYIEHDRTGILVPAELPGPLAGALRSLLLDEDVRLTYGAAGRRRVENLFPVEAMVRNTAHVYHKVLEVAGNQRPFPVECAR